MMSLWDALRMNMMISYQELVRTFLSLTVTEYDIDSVTCEMVRMVSSYGDQSTTRE